MTQSLRIAVFAYEFPALSETFVLNQITGLLDRGHDVRIFAGARRSDPWVHDDVHAYDLPRRTRYIAPPRNYALRIMNALWSVVTIGWRRPKLVLRCLDIRRYGRDALSLRLLHWALQLCDEPKFDVLHCHFGLIGQFVAKLRDAGAIEGRLSTVFHGVDMSACLVEKPDYYSFLFRHGDAFLPISEYWRLRLTELGCDSHRCRVHRMGVDTGRYAFQPRRRDPDEPLSILSVGRLVEKKGIRYGLAAAADAVLRGVDLRYRIVGDGPLRSELVDLAEDLGIGDLVEFLGWRGQDEVADLMASSDILLAPSVTAADGDQEGIPVTIMEAMSSGMLVVSTRHSGIPELVDDGRSGLLVAERDADALANALAELYRTPDMWPKMSRAGHLRVTEKFDIESLNGRFEELVHELAGTEGEIGRPRSRPEPSGMGPSHASA